jgi:hypothetical protein
MQKTTNPTMLHKYIEYIRKIFYQLDKSTSEYVAINKKQIAQNLFIVIISLLIGSLIIFSVNYPSRLALQSPHTFKELLLYRNETVYESNSTLSNNIDSYSNSLLTSNFRIETLHKNLKSTLFISSNIATSSDSKIYIDIGGVSINLALIKEN